MAMARSEWGELVSISKEININYPHHHELDYRIAHALIFLVLRLRGRAKFEPEVA